MDIERWYQRQFSTYSDKKPRTEDKAHLKEKSTANTQSLWKRLWQRLPVGRKKPFLTHCTMYIGTIWSRGVSSDIHRAGSSCLIRQRWLLEGHALGDGPRKGGSTIRAWKLRLYDSFLYPILSLRRRLLRLCRNEKCNYVMLLARILLSSSPTTSWFFPDMTL